MATNFIQPGTSIEYENSSGSTIESGDVVVVGGRIGIAGADIEDGDSGTVHLDGVFEVAKNTSTAFTQGDKLYWDTTPGELTTTATGNTFAGFAHEAAGSSATTGLVRLSETDVSRQGVAVASLGATTNLTALAVTATSLAAVATGGTPDCSAAAIDTVFDAVQTALDLKADNADVETLRTEAEARLDAIDAKIDALLTSLRNAGLIAS